MIYWKKNSRSNDLIKKIVFVFIYELLHVISSVEWDFFTFLFTIFILSSVCFGGKKLFHEKYEHDKNNDSHLVKTSPRNKSNVHNIFHHKFIWHKEYRIIVGEENGIIIYGTKCHWINFINTNKCHIKFTKCHSTKRQRTFGRRYTVRLSTKIFHFNLYTSFNT